MTDEALAQLIREVDDYLEAGPVGLYEFLWILNGEKVEGTRDDHLRHAKRALDSLLRAERGHLITLIWAQPDSEAELSRSVEDRDFDDPREDGSYVAITRG